MFTDLLTSSKGPGVIGTLLAIVVLAGFGGLMFLVTDNSKGPGLGAQIKEKEGKVKSLQDRTKHWEKAAVTYKEHRTQLRELESAKAKLKRKQVEVERAVEAVNAQKTKTVKLREKFEEYKAQYRIAERAKAVGEEMAKLETKDGKVYERVKIREVDALGMSIRHKDGFTRIEYKRLPDALCDRFQFSEQDAETLQKKEQAVVQRSVQGGANYKVARKILDLKNKLLATNQDIGKLEAEVKRKQAEIVSSKREVETAKERAQYYRSLPNKGLNWDKAKKYERRVDVLQKRISRASASISSNTSKISYARNERSSLQSEISKLEAELRSLKKSQK